MRIVSTLNDHFQRALQIVRDQFTGHLVYSTKHSVSWKDKSGWTFKFYVNLAIKTFLRALNWFYQHSRSRGVGNYVPYWSGIKRFPGGAVASYTEFFCLLLACSIQCDFMFSYCADWWLWSWNSKVATPDISFLFERQLIWYWIFAKNLAQKHDNCIGPRFRTKEDSNLFLLGSNIHVSAEPPWWKIFLSSRKRERFEFTKISYRANGLRLVYTKLNKIDSTLRILVTVVFGSSSSRCNVVYL